MNLKLISTMHKRKSLVLVGSMTTVLAMFLSQQMNGQSMDYGALEQLFKEPVTTSVNGSPQRVSDVPAAMEIITAEDIRRSGAKDIAGVLRHVGGVDTLEWGNDNIDVGIRGYNQAYSPRLLVLVDGRQVYSDDYGYTPWNAIPIELAEIRQIEIIKGPNSALFGFNAVGGVINIITFNPLYDNINALSLTGGTQGLIRGSAIATYKFGDRAALRLTAGGHSNDDFSTPIPLSGEASVRKHQYRAAFHLNSIFRLSRRMTLGVEASRSTTKQNDMGADYELDNSLYNTDSLRGQLTVESELGLVQATAYTNWFRLTDSPGLEGQPFHFKNQVAVAEIHDIFKVGANSIVRIAGEYRHNREGTTPTAGASIQYNVAAVSSMWDWKITPSISITNALRLDHLILDRVGLLPPSFPFSNADWNRSITQLSFNSGLVWKPSDKDALRFTAARGVQLPSLVYSGALLLDTPSLKATGSPMLKPTIVTNYEVGWDKGLGSHIVFRANAFHQHNEDLLAIAGGLIPTANGPYYLPSNIGSSDANGLEVGVKGIFLRNYRWGANYRPELVFDHFAPAAQHNAAYANYQDTTPLHLLKANLGWANGRWEIDSYFQYTSASGSLRPTSTGGSLIPITGFSSLDGRVGYNLTNWATWSISGQNLTHANQIQTSGPAVERRVLGTMAIHF